MTESAFPVTAPALLSEFLERTGVTGATPGTRRYLWTDAFAVCTLLGLDGGGAGGSGLEVARRLVDQVHGTLGRHRVDDPRSGWISGLSESEGRAHPTRGGLRIGKPLPERGPAEPEDERLEWERDGQYFHYLTKWMQALGCMARSSGEERYSRWALELAQAAHAGFTDSLPDGGPKRMAWKMSIDLQRPLVPGMGGHDPLDGLLTFRALEAQAARMGPGAGQRCLDGAIEDMRSMCRGGHWATADPLGIGGILCDAHRLARLCESSEDDCGMLPDLLEGALAGLPAFVDGGDLRRPPAERLAFRELGLSLGLHAVSDLARIIRGANSPSLGGLRRHVEALLPFTDLAQAIEACWLDPVSRRTDAWHAHLDINSVMLATSLSPVGYLSA